MNSPLAIANYLIQKSFDKGIEITPMKLVKLVYISHGWYLGLKQEPLITERIQAWKYGPVVESVYHTFKKYGGNQIESLESDCGIIPFPTDDIKSFLDKIYSVYGEFTAIQLSSLTHQRGTPWDIIWNSKGGAITSSTTIPNDLIKDHYKAKIKE
jgi:uncharacterized phage-associated protein